ncbi:MAG: hypothetical protein K0S04_596 [Herbinix sp.]|nr:hypothetical protein [Herbinix sp.]
MNVLVIDGQGGGVGRSLVEAISNKCKNVNIIAVGTNSAATTNMLKGRAGVDAATGENAVVYNCRYADVIVGPIGIVMANSMFGEVTPKMAEAVSSSQARLILIPMNRCHATVIGVTEKKLPEYIEEAVNQVLQITE